MKSKEEKELKDGGLFVWFFFPGIVHSVPVNTPLSTLVYNYF